MENNTNNQKFPKVMNNPSFRNLSILLFSFQLIIIVAGIYLNPLIGIGLLILFLSAFFLLKEIRSQLSSEINQYILDLSYKIKRGEQEALIKMPIGIVLLDDQGEIEWVNPYMQSHFTEYDEIIGKKLSDVDSELSEQIETSGEEDYSIIEWQEKMFRVTLQKEIHAIYLMDITEYVAIQEE